MSRSVAALVWLSLALGSAPGRAETVWSWDRIFGAITLVDLEAEQEILWRIEPLLGAEEISDVAGIARHPGDGTVYALIQRDPARSYELYRLSDELPPTATLVGSTGDFVTGAAFSASGRLYTLVYDPFTLEGDVLAEVDLLTALLSDTTAEITPFLGGLGGALLTDPSSGELVHIGSDADFGDGFIERIDPGSLEVTPVPPAAGLYDFFFPLGGAFESNGSLRVFDSIGLQTRITFGGGVGEEALVVDSDGVVDLVERELFYGDTRFFPAGVYPVVAQTPCVPSPEALCLVSGRFRVEVAFRTATGTSGDGVGRFVTADTGEFSFFSPDNVELILKVLDACALNQRFWVFGSASTDVEYTITVTDTDTAQVRTYANSLGTTAPAITDTDAFATCP